MGMDSSQYLLLMQDAGVELYSKKILYLFQNASTSEVALWRETTGNYWICQKLSVAPNRWWCCELAQRATIHSIALNRITTLLTSHGHVDASVTKTGAGWQINTVQAGCYTGTYCRGVEGDYLTWITPASVTAVGVRSFLAAPNGGIATVSIDGDLTRATLLSTAQQYVDAGTLPSTVLVANGGTLNPTDRVVNFRQIYDGTSTFDNRILFADDLTAGSHTVVITQTAYAQAGATARMYLTGMMYGTPSTQPSTVGSNTTDGVMYTREYAFSSDSVFEYAMRPEFVALGTTHNDWVGNGHGYDFEDSFTFAVDGVSQTPAVLDILYGTSVAVSRSSHLRHQDLGTLNIATVNLIYTMNATGLHVAYTITWLEAGTMLIAYIGMMPFDEAFNRGANVEVAGDATLTNNDGSLNKSAYSNLAYLWQSAGYLGGAMYIENLAQAILTTGLTAIEDRSTGAINKIYCWRSSLTESMADNQVWAINLNYRIGWFPNGANASLAGQSTP